MHLVVPPGGSFRETRRVELGARALTLGRSEACDIQLDVPGVDAEHAKITEVALVAVGADCAVGDIPLDAGGRRLVMPGDEIQIGSVVVAVEGDDPSIPLLATDGEVGMAGKPPHAPRIRVVEGHNFGDELTLGDERREYVVGRSPNCDLVLEDREVSREHIKLVRRGYAVYIIDLASTRGSWLGRSNVYSGSTTEWSRPRMLKVGATVLSLELPDEIRKAAPGAQASAPMTPEPRRKRGAPNATNSAPPPAFEGSPSKVPPSDYDLTPPPVSALVTPATGTQVPAGATLIAASGAAPGRKAWKGSAPIVGKVSGILLLALAGLAILGALFVVFSLME